jgi:uncharacterized surface protein with fasciclin (FAS1) repeats
MMTRTKRNVLRTTLGVFGALVLAGGIARAGGEMGAARDVVDTAVAAGEFKTLATALQAAGLVDTLKGEGPFTVFAPTDAAFRKLPTGTLDALLADKARLKDVLTYHVVPGKVVAAEVVKMKDAATVEGQRVKIQVVDGKVKVDDATVTKTDIMASNGVIHVIDAVILPN